MSQPSALRVHRVESIIHLEALSEEWEALDRRIRPRTPFTSPLWNLLWWQHFRAREPLVRDELFAYVVRGLRGDLRAVAPMMITHRPSFGPFRLRQLHFFGADTNLTEVRGLACLRHEQREAIAAVVGDLARHAERWDWLEWSGIEGNGGAERGEETGVPDGVPLYYLSLPSRWEELKARLPRNAKEALRKCYNSLEREGHAWTFEVVQDPALVPAALETFFRLHRARAVAPDMVAHSDVFASHAAREFFSDYAIQMAVQGKLRLFQLRIGGETVAARVGFVLGDELYLYYSGYDPRWRRFSVMTTVVAEAIQWAIRQGLGLVNLSSGRDGAKLRWRPAELLFKRVVMPAPTLRGSLSLRAYERLSIGLRSTSLQDRLLTLIGRTRSRAAQGAEPPIL